MLLQSGNSCLTDRIYQRDHPLGTAARSTALARDFLGAKMQAGEMVRCNTLLSQQRSDQQSTNTLAALQDLDVRPGVESQGGS